VKGVIVALDLPDAESAVALAEAVSGHVAGFEIGLGLLHGPGPLLISALVGLGKPVLVDAKLYDEPARAGAAARQLGRHGARWVTAHVGGGQTMLERVVEGLREGAGGAPSGVLGVTILRSLDRPTLAKIGIDRSPGKLVARMARVAAAAGCEGVISSPHELPVVGDVAPELLKVTSGIRPASSADHPEGTMTPEQAVSRGADLLVVGSPIIDAADPVEAAEAINAEVHSTGRSD
jgi:orotidine-5'-phosphate decarboxylase